MFSNFKQVDFRTDNEIFSKRQFSTLNFSDSKSKIVVAKDIRFPREFLIINPNLYLFSCISLKIKLKCVMDLKL